MLLPMVMIGIKNSMNKIWSNEKEILEFAQKLEGHTVAEMNSPYALTGSNKHKGKGKFGQYVENEYFGIETNNSPEADFYPIPLELKTTGLKTDKKGNLSPKERMPLSMIDYNQVVNETFDNSHFTAKNSAVLMIWYLYERGQANSERLIKLADIWECLKEDREQIERDFLYIQNKIKDGKAHELSEGDTLYLGACTKGDKASNLREQPNSPIMARRRAFCFKQPYMRYIWQTMIDRKKNRSNKNIESFCKPGQSLEEAIAERFHQYIGMRTDELCRIFEVKNHTKSTYSSLAKEILGADHKSLVKKFKEFKAADLQIKCMRLNVNGKSCESMSFPAMDYCEIAGQDWEDSDLYMWLTRKFICPVFQQLEDGSDEYYLKSIKVWNMPENDLEIVEQVWLDTKNKIIAGDYDHFIGSGKRMVAHVRPHDRKALYNTPTPQGILQKKKSFWLNDNYINVAILEAIDL